MAIKRRLSTLGSSGPLIEIMMGLRGVKVIFRTFGRICPIEAPESSKIDLISSLRAYALINDFGFVETSYRVMKNGHATDKIAYISTSYEKEKLIAQEN